jgi:hypothetical protein
VDLWQILLVALVTAIPSLYVGVLIGRNNDQLARTRSKDEARVTEERAVNAKCTEIFNARVDYVIHRMGGRSAGAATYKVYTDIWKNNWHARPEVYVDPEVWQVWMDAEKAAQNQDTSPRERRDQIRQAQIRVLDWIAAQRRRLVT